VSTSFSSSSDLSCAVPALIVRPAHLDDINLILALHREAFADKFGGAFGVDGIARGTAALATAWQRQGQRALQGMFVAEYQQHIIGTITLRTWDMANEENSGAVELAFQQMLGLWGATRSIFALSLLSHHIGRQEGFVTDVAVQAAYRRQGVARHLLAHVEEEGRRRHKHYLGLYVSKSNTDAQKLYRSIGFFGVRVRRSWLTRLFFGQREWLYMRKNLR
jgi:ribosomal protein S18 acetylase RimI-like enzyme